MLESTFGKYKDMKGRFAPSPSGRMHLGNIFSALLSWLSAKSAGGEWILRIEDLDPQRSKEIYGRLIEDDLIWLGLEWDEGGYDAEGGQYRQSMRHNLYEEALKKLIATRYTYPCTCRRADILATQAPHQSDGRVIYGGRCRPNTLPCFSTQPETPHATRLYVPDKTIEYTDKVFGRQAVNLTHECGDFILRRADGAWAYQLAVVVDDAAMGVTEVARGSDLLLSAAQQIYIYSLLNLPAPEFAHIPLLCNAAGQRLSKRDKSMSMEELRKSYKPEEIIGKLAALAGLRPTSDPVSAKDLIRDFSWSKLKAVPSIILD